MFRGIVKMMQNAGQFLANPILQYIPITIHTLAQNNTWPNPYNQPSPHLFLFQNEDALQSALNRFQIQLTSTPPAGDLYVLCLNFHADLVLFRYLTCKIIGESKLGSVHVFAITKKYFPRRSLHFGLYENDGRKYKGINQDIY